MGKRPAWPEPTEELKPPEGGEEVSPTAGLEDKPQLATPDPVSDVESEVYKALDEYEAAQKNLAVAEAKALGVARGAGARVPRVNEIVQFWIEDEQAVPMAIAAQVLFVHSATVVTLVASKHDGARHTHSNVRYGERTGQWSWR